MEGQKEKSRGRRKSSRKNQTRKEKGVEEFRSLSDSEGKIVHENHTRRIKKRRKSFSHFFLRPSSDHLLRSQSVKSQQRRNFDVEFASEIPLAEYENVMSGEKGNSIVDRSVVKGLTVRDALVERQRRSKSPCKDLISLQRRVLSDQHLSLDKTRSSSLPQLSTSGDGINMVDDSSQNPSDNAGPVTSKTKQKIKKRSRSAGKISNSKEQRKHHVKESRPSERYLPLDKRKYMIERPQQSTEHPGENTVQTIEESPHSSLQNNVSTVKNTGSVVTCESRRESFSTFIKLREKTPLYTSSLRQLSQTKPSCTTSSYMLQPQGSTVKYDLDKVIEYEPHGHGKEPNIKTGEILTSEVQVHQPKKTNSHSDRDKIFLTAEGTQTLGPSSLGRFKKHSSSSTNSESSKSDNVQSTEIQRPVSLNIVKKSKVTSTRGSEKHHGNLRKDKPFKKSIKSKRDNNYKDGKNGEGNEDKEAYTTDKVNDFNRNPEMMEVVKCLRGTDEAKCVSNTEENEYATKTIKKIAHQIHLESNKNVSKEHPGQKSKGPPLAMTKFSSLKRSISEGSLPRAVSLSKLFDANNRSGSKECNNSKDGTEVMLVKAKSEENILKKDAESEHKTGKKTRKKSHSKEQKSNIAQKPVEPEGVSKVSSKPSGTVSLTTIMALKRLAKRKRASMSTRKKVVDETTIKETDEDVKRRIDSLKEYEPSSIVFENEYNISLSKLAELKETAILGDDYIEPYDTTYPEKKCINFGSDEISIVTEEDRIRQRQTNTRLSQRRDSKVRQRQKKVIDCCKKFVAFLFSHIGLCSLVVAYSIMGGFIFRALESPFEQTTKMDIARERERLVTLLWDLTVEVKMNNASSDYSDQMEMSKMLRTNFKQNVNEILRNYSQKIHKATKERGWDGQDTGNGEEVKIEQWTFPSSLLFAITILTTIGYGHVAPKTNYGRIVTIAYAVLGIPLTLLCLTNIGDVMAHGFRWLYGRVCCGLCCILFRPARRKLPDPERAISMEEERMVMREDEKIEEVIHVPTSLCILLMTGYILLGTLMFSKWESWDFITGTYFCFITLSTIGFGDVVPGTDTDKWDSEEKLVLCAMYLIFGLSLIAMCFNLVQEDVKAKCRWLGTKLGIIEKPVSNV
ncbi:hypothetical protein CHS0354_003715 [Potamilus streckersoni]|uniref:Potassium channel domain-containing protein n=1 Tax=Potamilus streckersoni TaxID=2493646 RepID=A0AAE0W1V6_9BIVA|nr:hypothetical protein CHS0354_003715 [Potamilus streckersoni]